MIMKQYIGEFLGNLDAPFAKNTQLCYRGDLNQYFEWAEMNNYDSLNPDILIRWFDYLKTKGVKNSTLHRKRAALRQFFAYCVEEEYISINPALAIKKIKTDKLVKKPIISDQEVIELYKASQDNLRDRTILQVAIDMGLRNSEICDLDISNLDLTNLTVYIKPGKNRVARMMPLTYLAAAFIKKYLDTRNDNNLALFITYLGSRLSRQSFHKLFAKYVKKSKIKSTYTVHSCRWKFGTNLANKGFEIYEIQILMGHLDPESTRRYISRSTRDRSKTYRKYNQD